MMQQQRRGHRSRPASPYTKGYCDDLSARSRNSDGTPSGRSSAPPPSTRRPKSAHGFRLDERKDPLRNAKSEKASSDGDSVSVLVRARPPNNAELHAENWRRSLTVDGNTVTLTDSRQERRAEPYAFTFDNVFKENTKQEEVFKVAGIPIVKNVLDGYNSTIFAYGQTGAGKTYTMMGIYAKSNSLYSEHMGIAPRVLEYLFEKINKEEQSENAKKNDTELTFTVRCSFIEIYNENIMDLLHPAGVNLPVRDDKNKGPYVEGLREVVVRNSEQALSCMVKGIDNRKVSETKMNKNSSRSHCIYTCCVERVAKSGDGSIQVRHSRLNLVDLAGSERNRSSGAAGEQLKEAIHINKSLTTLGRVIRELIECQKSGNGHIPYRDSRLTHLLQESLGGNAKTTIIANVSPSAVCSVETLSTLQFVANAKNIKNCARVNEDLEKEMKMCEALNKQILQLKQENEDLRNGAVAREEIEELEGKLETESRHLKAANCEISELKQRLEAEQARADKLQAQLDATIENNAALRSEASLLNGDIDTISKDRDALANTLEMLNVQADELHEISRAADEKAREVASTERAKLLTRLRNEELNRRNNGEVIGDLQSNLTTMGQQLVQLREREREMLNELEMAREVMEKQQVELERLDEELCTSQNTQEEKWASIRSIEEELAREKDASAGLEAALESTRTDLSALKSEMAKKEEEIAMLGEEGSGQKQSNEELDLKVKELTAHLQSSVDMRCELEQINTDLRQQLEEVRNRHKESIEEVWKREQHIDYLQHINADLCTKLENESYAIEQLSADREQLNKVAWIFGDVVERIQDSIRESDNSRSPTIINKIMEYDARKDDAGSVHDSVSSRAGVRLRTRNLNGYGDMHAFSGGCGYGMEAPEFPWSAIHSTGSQQENDPWQYSRN